MEEVGRSVSGKQMLYDKVYVQIHLMWVAEEAATGVTLGWGGGGGGETGTKISQHRTLTTEEKQILPQLLKMG